ncbi:MAG: hypothetical protein ACI93R_000713 [Flavobacteriales bacterium]
MGPDYKNGSKFRLGAIFLLFAREPMKTLLVLNESEESLAPKLKVMKLKELERHAKKICTGLSESFDYEVLIRNVIKRVPNLTQDVGDRFKTVQDLIVSDLYSIDAEAQVNEETVRRLAVILMVIITKKFEKIMKEQR